MIISLSEFFIYVYFILATLGLLCCCSRLSRVAASGGYSLLCAQDSHCGGFSCCGSWALGTWAQ